MIPGSSAIIAGIEQQWIEDLLTVLEEYDAQVVRHALDEEISQTMADEE